MKLIYKTLVAAVLLTIPLSGIAANAQTGNSGLEALLDTSTSNGGPKVLKDLSSPGWKHIRLQLSTGGKEQSAVGGLFGALMGGEMGGAMGSVFSQMTSGVTTAGDDVYYTQGKTVALGTETFLVTYRPQTGEDNGMANLLKISKSDTPPPAPKPMNGETPVTVTLINLHSIATLKDIKPFDLSAEIAASVAQASVMSEMMKDKNGSVEISSDPPPKPKTAKPTKPKS